MKNSIFSVLVLSFILVACNSDEKQAKNRLEQAKGLYEQGELNAARNEVDSIRALYPNQFKVLQEGLDLMRRIEITEADRAIAFCDSLLPIRQAESIELMEGFVLEKDEEYQLVGNYVWKLQSIERNVKRSYVRSRVSEKGEMFLESVYFGERPINHTHIKVSNNDGDFAETTVVPFDGGLNYRFEDLGNYTEVVTYAGKAGEDVVKFLYIHEAERIKVEYLGDKRYIIYLNDADKKALVATYNLATVLNDIDNMETGREKAVKRKEYLQSKL